MRAAGVYYIVVIADSNAGGRLVGTASLIVERKFTHQCGKARRTRTRASLGRVAPRRAGRLRKAQLTARIRSATRARDRRTLASHRRIGPSKVRLKQIGLVAIVIVVIVDR